MKRADLADEIEGVGFIDWVISPVGLRANAKIAGVPHGRVWLIETQTVAVTGPPPALISSFSAAIGYDRGKVETTGRHDSAFAALVAAAKLFPNIAAPNKVRHPKNSGNGPLFGA